MKRIVLSLSVLLGLAGCSENATSPSTRAPSFATGSPAGFTATYAAAACQNGPGIVNCNIYLNKADVALNAGPSGATLDDGTYFFAVVAPGGQAVPNDGAPNLLSTDAYTARDFTVSGGVVSYPGPHAIDGDGDIQLLPYLNTTNHGGVYILAICNITAGYPATAANCKYDAFKVVNQDECTGDCTGGTPDGTLEAVKYYDADESGTMGANESLISGWLMQLYNANPFVNLLDDKFTPNASWSLQPGDYVVVEGDANEAGWVHTDPATAPFQKAGTVVSEQTTTLYFGNVCHVTPGGHTLGFWSNRNGQALITTGDRTALNAFFLANATGNQPDFSSSAAIKTWLLSANATNMAYMLSAQMTATYLSRHHGFTTNAIVDYVDSDFDAGYPAPRTVDQEIAYANYLLSQDQTTIVSDAMRAEQQRVKNIFDTINNGLSITPPTLADALAACGTPTFGTT